MTAAAVTMAGLTHHRAMVVEAVGTAVVAVTEEADLR
jgi:hypothetical protein